MQLFDTHAHLTDERFRDDLTEVLSRAHDEGVRQIVIPSSNMADAQKAVDIATQYTSGYLCLYCAVGVHPHDASTLDEVGYEQLKEKISDRWAKRIVALGEIGLDYHYDYSPRDVQKEAFMRQLNIATEYQCPIIIHERKATEDMLVILRDYYNNGRLLKNPGVFHCFSGSVQTAQEVLKMGFMIGFDGPITFKNNRKSLEVIESVPVDKLLIETDSPYLTPEPFRGKRNEPAYLRYILEKMAEVKGLPILEMAEKAYKNAEKLFQTEKISKGKHLGY